MVLPTADELAQLCFKQFDALPTGGKPIVNEWTVLSGIVLHNSSLNETKVVSLGAGTKCIGQSKLCSRGLILNDSHAEVLARRAFMRYLYKKLGRVMSMKGNSDESDDAFQWDKEKMVMQLKPGISFHFVSTQAPCGDACIDREQPSTAQNYNDFETPTPAKVPKLFDPEEDNHLAGATPNISMYVETQKIYTGAKLLGNQHNDSMQQTLGAVRTKPGRGDRTLSMSCSDKLARWNVLGVQGALLDVLLEAPIYLKTFNFCCTCKEENLKRAIYRRFNERDVQIFSKRFQIQQPEIRVCSNKLVWKYAQKSEKHERPSPRGLAWCAIDKKTLRAYEVSVSGKRLGITKKILQTPFAALCISKYNLLKSFIEIIKDCEPKLLKKFQLQSETLYLLKYNDYKQMCKHYQAAWLQAKQKYFLQWVQKPPTLLQFCLFDGCSER